MEVALAVSQIISALVLTLTLVAIVLYTKKTSDMAKATEDMALASKQSADLAEKTLLKMDEARLEESAPYVVAYFDVSTDPSFIYLVVKNVGKSVATDVTFEFTPPLVSSRQGDDDPHLLSTGISSMAPGFELRALFDGSIDYYGKKLPLIFNAVIGYTGELDKKRRTNNQTLDLAVYNTFGYVVTKDIDDLVKQLETLVSHISDIKDTFKQASKTLTQGIWIKNAELLMTDSPGSSPRGLDDLVSKLVEIGLIWRSAPRDGDGEVTPYLEDLIPQLGVLEHQLVALIAKSAATLSSETRAKVDEICLQLRQATTTRYLGGRSSWKKFNDLGDNVAVQADEAVVLLKKDSDARDGETSE